MAQRSSPAGGLPDGQQPAPLRWAEAAQWFGLVLLLLSIGLAALAGDDNDSPGMSAIVLCGAVGLLVLVLARLARSYLEGHKPGR